ncbi:MAG TPA: aldehyde dehydrogenase [Smithellaceae bacterium]|nr:aldehyde dehydrogenase [Smithellaceae bacterium]
MNSNNWQNLLKAQKEFFSSGRSRDIEFRVASLNRLKEAIKSRERDVLKAIFDDLHKNEFDAYATEIGIVYNEINFAIKNLRAWAKTKKVRTPLFMWPAKSYVRKEPYGVVLIIAPWNYPFQLIMAPLVGAMAAGNTAILKPSEISPHTAAVIETIINNTFPAEYICAVQGTAAETQSLLELPVDYIFFTGSIQVGRLIARTAATNLIPFTLELGGKSPAVVCPDVQITNAARKIAWGKFLNAGQTCVAPDYVLVHESVKDDFLAALKKVITDFYGEDAAKHERYCRIINDRHFRRLEGLLQSANIFSGGKTDRISLYIEPTILHPASWDEPVMQDEIFGPLLPVLVFSEINEIIKKINERPKPLSLYLFSENPVIQKRITGEISYGGGAINNTIVHVASQFLPFGGVGSSGVGRYHGKAGFDTFTYCKSLVKSSGRFDPGLAYPDKNPGLKLLKMILR